MRGNYLNSTNKGMIIDYLKIYFYDYKLITTLGEFMQLKSIIQQEIIVSHGSELVIRIVGDFTS